MQTRLSFSTSFCYVEKGVLVHDLVHHRYPFISTGKMKSNKWGDFYSLENKNLNYIPLHRIKIKCNGYKWIFWQKL